MGFWKKSFQVLQDLTSLGGTSRMRSQTERYQRLTATYELLRKDITDAKTQLFAAVERIRTVVKRATRSLQIADAILAPLGLNELDEFKATSPSPETSLLQGATGSLSNVAQTQGMNTSVPTMIGGVSGISATASSWGVVQLVAHASTGTAMAGLHGAAAVNAGWAWFGGGSLATGGGGMAAGHFVLPGIGTAVAVAVSTTLSHREANRINKLCEEIEGVNEQNTSCLSKVNSGLNIVSRLENKLSSEEQLLDDALNHARRKVRRFGWLSHCWRLLRLWINGYYYTQDESVFVERLGDAVARFISAFKDPLGGCR